MAEKKGLTFPIYFHRGSQQDGMENLKYVHDFTWVQRDAEIRNANDEVIFQRRDITCPSNWSDNALNIVASKYLQEGESVSEMVGRVVGAIKTYGEQSSYFKSAEDADNFSKDLTYLLVHQMASFNSPVWFNCGVHAFPQCSACFINSVEDSMESILDLAKTEGMLFKGGSGTGTNFSPIRAEGEPLSGGGTASGPISFMKGFDAFAGAIKSGGTTRRAAKMVILDADHPDIEKFIWVKTDEEEKARALIDAGYDPAIDGEAYGSVFFQNSNNSVRVSDEFMLKSTKPGSREAELLRQMAGSAHACGDPGIQFDATINQWHTCPNSGRINASNPCSEFMFLDDTACNLASLNLLKFVGNDGRFNCFAFKAAVKVMIVAQEILVGLSDYPTEKITSNSLIYRPLGLGYANLGALLMERGLPYDSHPARITAAAITSLMTATAYFFSAEIARCMGYPCEGFKSNKEPFMEVIRQHKSESNRIARTSPSFILATANDMWKNAEEHGDLHGFMNCQVTVLAPTGTIGFMMDCDTTGVEPELALVKHKNLVGGGSMDLVNSSVSEGLRALGMDENAVRATVVHVREHGTVEDSLVQPEDWDRFDCAFPAKPGGRSIAVNGHLKMVAAVQPFLSGAVSKTINLPEDATVRDVVKAYKYAWTSGLKSISVYRNNSKGSQPLNVGKGDAAKPDEQYQSVPITALVDGERQVVEIETDDVVFDPPLPPENLQTEQPVGRRRPEDVRDSVTHKFSIGGHKGYLTVGMFENGDPCEIFINMSKQGSTISGLMDSFACMTSFALQYGVPLEFLVGKLAHTRYDPSGWTGNPDVPYAKSITDYVFRWLAHRFLDAEEPTNGTTEKPTEEVFSKSTCDEILDQAQWDCPICTSCGSLMSPSGSCYKCANCGGTSGCS